jgi:hypothetical protein
MTYITNIVSHLHVSATLEAILMRYIKVDGYVLYRVILSLEAPNYCL